jgi:hypothetical protein
LQHVLLILFFYRLRYCCEEYKSLRFS